MIKHRIKVYSTLGQRSSIPTTSRRSLLNMKDVSLCILNFNRFLYTSLVCVCVSSNRMTLFRSYFLLLFFFFAARATPVWKTDIFICNFAAWPLHSFFRPKLALNLSFFSFFLGTELETSKVCTRQPRNRFSHNQNVDSTTAKERE